MVKLAVDGYLNFNTKVDITGINKGVKETEKAASKASTSAKRVAETASQSVEKVGENTGNAVKKASEKASTSAEKVANKISEEADETANKINEILNDTTRSMKSKASAIAGIYRKQGLNQSQAMIKAWAQIERVSKSGNKKLKFDHTSTTQKILKNTDKIKSGCSSIGTSIGKIGNRLNTLKNTVIATFSFAAIAQGLKALTESSATVKAMGSQYEQTFGDLSANAKKAMQDVAKNSGIVETRLQGVGTSIYAFAKTTGMDSVTALNMMQEALQVTADSAAYYDRSLEDTSESLKSFLKGNYENDSALGLSCTETTRNTMANKLYGKSFIELSESQKQLALLQMVKEANQLSGAMGQASREADGWENVTGNLKESWKQLLAVVGQPVLQVATQAVKHLTSALQTLTGYAQQAVNAMYEVFGWKKDDTANAITAVSDSADSATESIEKTTEANEKLKNSLAGFDKLNVLSQDDSNSSEDTSITPTATTPISSAIAVQDIDTTPLDKFYKKFETTFGKIKSLVTSGDFKGLGAMLASKFNSLLDSINWTNIQSKAKEWTSNITGFLNGAISETNWFLVGSTLGEAFNTVLTSLHTFITEFEWSELGNTLADSINGFISTTDWGLVAQTLSASILGLVDTTIAFLEETDWSKIGEAIAEFISNIDWVTLYNTINYKLFFKLLGALWDIWCGLLDGLGITEYWTDVALGAWEGVQNVLSNVKEFFTGKLEDTKNVFSNIGDWFKNIFSIAWANITNAFSNPKQFFSKVWNSIKSPFGNVADWFKNTFKTAWTGVKNVFSAGGKIFEGIKDGISSVFTTVVNGLIDGINTVIATPFNTINDVLDTIRSVEIAGWYPFEGLTTIPVPQIPKLATGTVVPANYGEFTAILGDNKREPEIVSPLSTMKQALKEVVEEIGIYPNDNGDTVIVLELDSDVVFKKVVKRNNQYKKRHGGKSAFASS